MEEIPAGISILTAMVTPAILILASGSLLLTTSQRLNRSIERARKLSVELKEIHTGKRNVPDQERMILVKQLNKAAERAILLQRSMTLLYIALFFFISDSLLIGIFEILQLVLSWILIIVSLSGVLLLFAASFTLILETRLAYNAVKEEMNFRLLSGE